MPSKVEDTVVPRQIAGHEALGVCLEHFWNELRRKDLYSICITVAYRAGDTYVQMAP